MSPLPASARGRRSQGGDRPPSDPSGVPPTGAPSSLLTAFAISAFRSSVPADPARLLPDWARKKPRALPSLRAEALGAWSRRAAALMPRARPLYKTRRRFLLNDARFSCFRPSISIMRAARLGREALTIDSVDFPFSVHLEQWIRAERQYPDRRRREFDPPAAPKSFSLSFGFRRVARGRFGAGGPARARRRGVSA